MNKQPNGWLAMKNENIVWLCQELVHDVESRRIFFSSFIHSKSARYGAQQNRIFKGKRYLCVAEKTTEMSLASMQTLAIRWRRKKSAVSMQITGQISAAFFSVFSHQLNFVANRARCLICNFNRRKKRNDHCFCVILLLWQNAIQNTHKQSEKNENGISNKISILWKWRCPRLQLEISIDAKTILIEWFNELHGTM